MKYFNFRRHLYILIIPVLLIILILLFKDINISKKTLPHSTDSFALDTIISITIYDSITDDEASNILSECTKIISEYENLLSRTKEGSDIYRINNSNGNPTEVSLKTIELLNQSIDFAKMSQGVIDPTIGSLSILWNIGSNKNSGIPSSKDIINALSTVDYKNILIDGNTVTLKNKDTKIDLGFIAKGYISDKLKEYMISSGVSSATINLGGNITVIGTKSDNTPFTIGITDPINKDGPPIEAIKASNTSIVSSGNYERFFEYEGTKYHHILSTENGYPVNSGLSQVTIICDESTTADALSTLCFILGYDDAITFLSSNYPDIQAIFVDNDGKIINDNNG